MRLDAPTVGSRKEPAQMGPLPLDAPAPCFQRRRSWPKTVQAFLVLRLRLALTPGPLTL